MKILHTADWHLGKKLYNFERLEEQRCVLNEIIEIADHEKVDVIVISGDVFDSVNPSSESTELLYSTLKTLTADQTRPVIVTAGNHDSADRINAPNALARACGIILIGNPYDLYSPISNPHWSVTRSEVGYIEITFSHGEKISITTSAFTNEVRLKEYISDENEESGLIDYFSNLWSHISKQYHNSDCFNLLMSHQLIWSGKHVEFPVEDDGEKSINLGGTSVIPSDVIPESYDYVALGHLHRNQKIEGPSTIYYSGSPIAYSFSESNQKKYINIIHTQNNCLSVVEKKELLSGKKLLTHTFKKISDAEQWIRENADHHLEMRLYVDEFMTSEDNRRLRSLTSQYLNIIPIVTDSENEEVDIQYDHNNYSDMTATFKAFFKEEKNIEPNEEILNLFQEIISLTEK